MERINEPIYLIDLKVEVIIKKKKNLNNFKKFFLETRK